MSHGQVLHTRDVSFWIDKRSGYTAFSVNVTGRSGGTAASINVALSPEEVDQLRSALLGDAEAHQ